MATARNGTVEPYVKSTLREYFESFCVAVILALGSALASIGLTIPAVAVVSVISGLPVTLGIDTKSTLLLILALFTIMLSFGTGRTTVLQGVVLLVVFAVYLFTTIVP